MKKNITIYCFLALATILGLGACSSDDVDQIPAGKGQVEVRLTARYNSVTRATGDWLDPTDTKEKIHEYWVAFVNTSGNVEELVHGDALGAEEHTFRFILPPGVYTAYAFANLPEPIQEPSLFGIVKGEAMPDLTKVKLPTTNGWTRDIPMTSHVGGQTIEVIEAENQSFEVELIRTMAKLELTFINNSQQQMDIKGYEIFPLTKTNVSLLEPTTIVKSDSVSYKVEFPTGSELRLLGKSTEDAVPATQTTYLYVNETNATATSTKNQYSIRIFVQRHRADTETIEEEMRYGFTVNSQTTGSVYDPTKENYQGENTNGFDYIHRNDWIKLPIMFTDWTFRVEALPFPPIAGFQARVLSADALSITFNSGGYIFLRPMFRNNHDEEGIWRGFDDSDVTFKLRGEPYIVNGTTAEQLMITETQPYGWTTPATGVAESIDPTTRTGIVMTGALDIFEQRFVQLPSGDIVGKLINDDHKNGQVTVTIKLQLGGFDYQFNYNILKQS